jgi:hypothetical protein
VDATSKKYREASYCGADGVVFLDRRILPIEPEPPPRLPPFPLSALAAEESGNVEIGQSID